MIPGVIARRWATALLEIGTESGQLEPLVDEVQRVAQTYEESTELRAALADPTISVQAKQELVHAIAGKLGASTVTNHTLDLLVQRRRMPALPAIAARLREMADARRGLLRAEVLTAMPLPEEYFDKLQKQLERITGRRIVLDRKLDPSLICGVVARVGDTVYDGSLVSRIRQMKESMLPN